MPAREIGGLGVDVDDDLVELRLALSPGETERLASLGADAARALEIALREWTPGERDFDVQARVAEQLESAGAFGACLIVGGDERVERFRHPLAAGEPMHRLVMAVVVAERHGLHAAATRFACAGRARRGRPPCTRRALAVEEETLAACEPGATYGDVLGASTGRMPTRAIRAHGPATTRAARSATASASSSSCRRRPTAAGSDSARDGPRGGVESEHRGRRARPRTRISSSEHGLRRLTDTGAWPLERGRPAYSTSRAGRLRSEGR